jgi:predicted Rossmann-fold nucleotide-binding protein
MSGFDLPYQPIRQELYAPDELFKDFDPADPASWGKTVDFKIYCHFVIKGRSAPTDPYEGMMQALHDNSITQSTYGLIKERKVAAVMGDHALPRNSAAYRDVAILARRLTRSGFLMCTGGGPGAMEASHLGALLAASVDSDLDKKLALLKIRPEVPDLKGIVNTKDGNVKIDKALVAQAHAWFKPAYDIYKSISSPSHSLAVPTWDYGQEPTTPFATHTAKYFQNSIREDGLLALAKQGIVFSEGKAGTIQEIFQNGAQNYYNTFGYFSPMVLFGVEYWTKIFPVVGVLRKLFSADFDKHVLVTDDVNDAAKYIETFIP